MIGSRPLLDEEIDIVAQILLTQGETPFKAERNCLLFIIGHRTGFRISELLSICVKNCFAYGTSTPRITVERRNMKGQKQGRSVAAHPQIMEYIQHFIIKWNMEPNDVLFPAHCVHGKSLSRISAWKILDNAFEAAKLTGILGTHCMRKTFAKRVFDRLDGDLMGVQRALGHKDINNTVKYLSFAQEDIDDAITGD